MLPNGFKYTRYEHKRPLRWAVRCKVCGQDTTQYHSSKEEALEEYNKRGHSQDMCEWFQTQPE